jgi:arylsulfatase A-like enzyme
VWVDDEGYDTAWFGKVINAAEAEDWPGLDTMRILNGHIEQQEPYTYDVWDGTSNLSPGVQVVDYLRDECISFIQGATEPWFATFAPPSPHVHQSPPVTGGHVCKTPAAYLGRYAWWRHDTIELGEDMTGKPTWMTALSALTAADIAAMRRRERWKLGALAHVDDAIVSIIEAIDAEGQLDDTVIFLTADNGGHLGEHRIQGPITAGDKSTMYEEALRVFLVCSGPGFTNGYSDELVSLGVDLCATQLEIAGGTASLSPQDGVSLYDVQNDPGSYEDRAILHQMPDSSAIGAPLGGTGMSTPTRKIMEWDDTGTDQYEMYDLDTDPRELVNVAFDAPRAAERAALLAQKDALLV